MKKIALLFPGNLASYFVNLDNYYKICDLYDIDIYILYSNKINYVHTFCSNINFNIEQIDIDLIKNKFGKNLKFIEAIENIDEYNILMEQNIINFKNKIQWSKNIDLMHNFAYNDFMDNDKIRKYLDQFLRLFYLNKIILESNIDYDYIIRARIDQFINYELLNNIINKLNENNIYNFITSYMDNFFIINKKYFVFINYIIENIGKDFNKKNNKYILGPEVQFNNLVNEYFQNIKIYNFNDINCQFEMSFCFLIKNKYVFYTRKNTNGIYFASYCNKNNINLNNYKNIIYNDSNFINNDNYNIILEKYAKIDILCYSII